MSESNAHRGSLYLPAHVVPTFDEIVEGGQCTWSGPEAKHAVAVRRLRVGEPIAISDGQGLVVMGVAQQISNEQVTMDVTHVATESLVHPTLTLVQALAKGDRDERAIEAATEIGVDRVIPWQASRSVAQWKGPKLAKHEAKWRNVVLAATKQSLRSRVPMVTSLADQTTLVKQLKDSLTIVLDPRGAMHLADAEVTEAMRKAKDIAFVVGPEGGLTAVELESFRQMGAMLVLLGDNVLRTSTAGPVALAIAQTTLGRWTTAR